MPLRPLDLKTGYNRQPQDEDLERFTVGLAF